MKTDEHNLQVACIRWFRYQHQDMAMLLYAIPNGGWRNAVVAAKLKAEGVVAGVADLCLDVARCGYHGLKIEMKTRSGRQSDSQKAYQKAVTEQGYLYVVCRSVDDFILAVERYLKGEAS